ncbi:MAG: hypothetical protein GHCLOJNM_00106 [bacterium]|nr:hypothetical protein [bacterium]
MLDRTNRIQVFSPDGEFLRGWTTPQTGRGNPRGLDVDRSGNILVADTHYGQVLRYSPEGALLQVIGKAGSGPGEFCLVTDVVEDSSGVLTTLEYGDKVRVQRLDPNGRFLGEWGQIGDAPGELRRPQGLALSPDGNLVVADSVNHRIQVFSPGGELLRIIGEFGRDRGQLNYPYDVAVDKSGRIYAIEFGNHRLQVFSPEGKALGIYGGAGRGRGEFSEPWGVTVLSTGEVLVADTKNDRIQNLGSLLR